MLKLAGCVFCSVKAGALGKVIESCLSEKKKKKNTVAKKALLLLKCPWLSEPRNDDRQWFPPLDKIEGGKVCDAE